MIALPAIPPRGWLWIGAALAVAGAVVYHVVTVSRLESANAKLSGRVAELTARNEVLSAENAKCADAVQNQNAAVAELLKQAEARAEAARQAVQAAERKAAQHAAEIDRLRRIPAPKPAEECQAIKSLLEKALP